MPSLIRFLFVVVILAVLGFAGMVSLTLFVEPNPREMSVRVPLKDLS